MRRRSRLRRASVAVALAVAPAALAPAGAGAAPLSGAPALAAARQIVALGPRPAGGAAERRAHVLVAHRFAGAGLRTTSVPFAVPPRGRSRNVLAVLDTPARCLDVVMAHADSVAAGPGANDNASGVGVLAALGPRLAALPTLCDVWLVATGAEERVVTGSPDHLGALALRRHLAARGRVRDLRLALSLDMVGRGRRFWLRSTAARPRAAVEDRVTRAAARVRVPVRWVRDRGTGASDHREFQLAGLPAAVLQAWRGEDPCWHRACDGPRRLEAPALARAQHIVEALLAPETHQGGRA